MYIYIYIDARGATYGFRFEGGENVGQLVHGIPCYLPHFPLRFACTYVHTNKDAYKDIHKRSLHVTTLVICPAFRCASPDK